jgi:hypothetical protein
LSDRIICAAKRESKNQRRDYIFNSQHPITSI